MVDDKKVFNEVSTYYNRLVNQYGHDPKACDYGTDQSQQIKFQIIGESCDFNNCAVLDVGCGFGDFSAYLAERYDHVTYTGIDISESMIASARKLHPELNLLHGNFFESAVGRDSQDYVIANGIFYLLGDEAPRYLQGFIDKALQVARRGVIFNTLSVLAPQKEAGEFYADPAEILKYCLSASPWVKLRHDYHHRDFTCWIFKAKQ